MVSRAQPSPQPKRHLGWFSRFCTSVTDRPTDRPRYSVSNNRPHLRTQYARCGLIIATVTYTNKTVILRPLCTSICVSRHSRVHCAAIILLKIRKIYSFWKAVISKQDVYMVALYTQYDSRVRRSGMARVNKISHTLPATHTFNSQVHGMSQTCLYFQPRSITDLWPVAWYSFPVLCE